MRVAGDAAELMWLFVCSALPLSQKWNVSTNFSEIPFTRPVVT